MALLLALCLLALVGAPAPAVADEPHVAVAGLRGIVNPVAASYVDRTLTQAERDGASVYVLQLDTPGGLDSSMRLIVQRILASEIPVLVYVSPAGGRAGSAGVYVAYSAHLAAMAPNTNIGSATPVRMGGSGEASMSEAMTAKVTNDAVAFIRGLAEQRGRNGDWAEAAVREAVNVGDQEALTLGVVNYVARDLADLLRQAEGARVVTGRGAVEVRGAGLPERRLAMQPHEELLHAIANPTLAYLLLSLGMLALVYELSNPGSILPGVVGGLALLLALYALGTLPINLSGLLLIAFAGLLLVLDLTVASHGVLTLGAIVAFLFGSAILIDTPASAPFLAIAPVAIVGMTAALALLCGLLVGSVWRARRQPATTGEHALLGQRAVAREALQPTGLVFLNGELWTATACSGVVAPAEEVVVVGVEGLHLRVRAAPRRLGEATLPARRPA